VSRLQPDEVSLNLGTERYAASPVSVVNRLKRATAAANHQSNVLTRRKVNIKGVFAGSDRNKKAKLDCEIAFELGRADAYTTALEIIGGMDETSTHFVNAEASLLAG